MTALPWLKWPGGKQRQVAELLEVLPTRWRHYHEPFLGGGALALALAEVRGDASNWAHLADLNPLLIRAWRGVVAWPGIVEHRVAIYQRTHSDVFYDAMRNLDMSEAR